MSDFMSFRRMVTPFVIQILFVLGCLAVVVAGAVLIGRGLREHDAREAVSGIGLFLFGPLVARIYAEILIVVFRINETLLASQPGRCAPGVRSRRLRPRMPLVADAALFLCVVGVFSLGRPTAR